MSPNSILVTSASGKIGRELVPLLLSTTAKDKTKLVLPTSSASRLSSAYPDDLSRLAIEEGQLSDPVWLESLCKTHAVETVFLNLGGQDELYAALGAFDAFVRAGVKHVIYLSAAGEFTSPQGVAEMLRIYGSAEVVAKVAAEQRLLYGRYPFKWTVVGPTLFFENDLMAADLLLEEGVLPQPLGEVGVSRVSCADIARVVVKSVEDKGEKLNGRKINVGTAKRFTGRQTEAIWSQALGREVHVAKGDEEALEAYEMALRQFIPGVTGRAVGRDLVMMARGWVHEGFGISEDEYRLTRAVLGKEADDYEEWVAKTAKELKEGK
ncbi:hypothetical protein Q7P37_004136 [Cladosporium fusiforme]